VLLVGLGSLAYFGILSPTVQLPSKCIFAPGIDCIDFKITQNSVTLNLLNVRGEDIILTGLSLSGAQVIGSCEWTGNVEVKSLATTDLTAANCNIQQINTKIKISAEVTWHRVSSPELSHTIQGELLARVE